MRHEKLISHERCVLMVMDVQEAFKAHIPDLDQVIKRCCIAIEAAKLLDVPIIVTEQYPKGLGRTVEILRNALGECKYYEKTAFSGCQDQAITNALLDTKRNQLLLVGIEAHVCIAQTALDSIKIGLQPYLAADAVGSRHDVNTQTALDRLQHEGVIITTTEAAILEMTGASRHPKFREISKLIK